MDKTYFNAYDGVSHNPIRTPASNPSSYSNLARVTFGDGDGAAEYLVKTQDLDFGKKNITFAVIKQVKLGRGQARKASRAFAGVINSDDRATTTVKLKKFGGHSITNLVFPAKFEYVR